MEDLFSKARPAGALNGCNSLQLAQVGRKRPPFAALLALCTTPRGPLACLQYGKVVSIDMKAPVRPPAFAFVEFA